MSCSTHKRSGFTLVELLTVIAIIGVLTGLLIPAIRSARLKARVARVHGELKDLSAGLEMYRNDCEVYPPARKECGPLSEDHNEYPIQVVEQRYVDYVPKDLFNTGPKYKYISPGRGWVNGWPQDIIMWVPNDYPDYQGENDDKDTDIAYISQTRSPVKWALWSVGPFGPLEFWESGDEHVPVPKRTWYEPGKTKRTKNGNVIGVITRLSNGRTSP